LWLLFPPAEIRYVLNSATAGALTTHRPADQEPVGRAELAGRLSLMAWADLLQDKEQLKYVPSPSLPSGAFFSAVVYI
jgi:hypothetical protein